MPNDLRGPAYRAALVEAHLELEQICERLAALRVRKEHLEGAVAALQPMMAAKPVPVAVRAQAPVTHSAPVVEMPAERKREAVRDVPMDPLQRHINQALGMAALA